VAQLGRFTHTAASSSTGIPASGASVTLYREGATVNNAQSGSSGAAVTVYHSGKLKTGDTVQVVTLPGTVQAQTYSVGAVTATTVVLSGAAWNVAASDRLIATNSQPTLYADDQGGTSTPNPLSTSATGLASCFIEYGAYDYQVSGGGLSTTFFVGMVSSTEAPGQVRYVDDFAANSSTGGIQEAVDDLPSAGGTVVLSGGKTYSTSASIWLHSGVTLSINGATIQRATGSITNGSANNSGAVINVSPKGSNGTPPTSSTSQSNIAVIGPGIIDGNQSAFTSLTNTSLVVAGVANRYTDGFSLQNVKIQNTLQDAILVVESKNVLIDNCILNTIGQWGVVSSRNGISLNNYNSASGWAERCTISNITMKDIGDEAIGGSTQWNRVSISNIVVDGCDFVIELGANPLAPSSISDWTISNISATNCLDYFITFNGGSAADYLNFMFSNITCTGHASLHDGGAINFNAGAGGANLTSIYFDNCRFYKINTKDTNSKSWINIQPDTGITVQDIHFNNLSMTGLSSSTRIGDVGFNLRSGTVKDVYLDNILIKDIPGIGIYPHNNSFAATVSNVHINATVVDGANYFGSVLRNDTAASTIKEIYFTDCVMKDCAKQAAGSNAGWQLNAAFAGSSIDHIYLNNCRSYKTSGSNHAYGLNLTQTAGTLGPVFLSDCDFSGTQTADMLKSGTITQLSCSGRVLGATQSITAVGDTITLPSQVRDCTILLDANGTYTLTSTPTIPDGGFDGQRLYIMNVDTGADIVRFADISGGVGDTNLLNSGSATWGLDPGDSIVYMWSSGLGAWVQIGGENTIA